MLKGSHALQTAVIALIVVFAYEKFSKNPR